MKAENVSLLNKLVQNYLNDLQIGEKDKSGNFVFAGATYYADNSNDLWESSYGKSNYTKEEAHALLNERIAYITENGVDDEFMINLHKDFNSGAIPGFTIIQVKDYVCELKNAKYIAKFIEYDAWWLDGLFEALRSTGDVECVRQLAKDLRFKRGKRYIYKQLKAMYKSMINDTKNV